MWQNTVYFSEEGSILRIGIGIHTKRLSSGSKFQTCGWGGEGLGDVRVLQLASVSEVNFHIMIQARGKVIRDDMEP